MVYTTALVLGQSLTEEESLVEMIGHFLSQLVSSDKSRRRCPAAGAARRGSVDSCDQHEAENNLPYTDLHSSLEEEDDEEVRTFQRDMTRQIERCLSEAKGSALPCEVLLLPRHMSARVGRDLVRSSAGEPCGLRGAAVNVYLLEESKTQGALKPLGSFSADPSVTPTFELSVVFKVDDDGWPPLKHIFHTDSKVLKLRPEYRLVKRKLYSSASPVVRDFC